MEYPIEGIKVEELEENDSYKKFLSEQNAYKEGFIRLQPYNQIMPKEYIKHAKRIHDFKIRPDDVWISSFPKCGKIFFSFYFSTFLFYFKHLKIYIHSKIT